LKFLKLKKPDYSNMKVFVKLNVETEEKDKRKILVGKNLPTKWFSVKGSYISPEEQIEIRDLLRL
jgi:hypothetical protein